MIIITIIFLKKNNFLRESGMDLLFGYCSLQKNELWETEAKLERAPYTVEGVNTIDY